MRDRAAHVAAGLVTAQTLSVLRATRRQGDGDPADLAARVDDQLVDRTEGLPRFVTALLGRLDRHSGTFDYVVAGHPPPLLLRQGTFVRELPGVVQTPLGVRPPSGRRTVSRERLEPGDRLLFYSDGVVEARDPDGAFFGLERLVDLAERAQQDGVPVAETLRRLTGAVLAHQRGRLQDDATLLLLDWSAPPSGPVGG